MGYLGWPPKVFWKATLVELRDALDGLAAFHGGDPDGEPSVTAEGKPPLTASEVQDLQDMLAAAVAEEERERREGKR